jgi:hypothetical protein
MKSILNVSNPYELNALFIQPTRWCGLNCKGCYVKEHAGGEAGHHIGSWHLIELFKIFYQSQEIHNHTAWANQITISIDDMPKDKYRALDMLNLFSGVLTEIVSNRQEERPEVHLTFHTPKTLREYTYEAKDQKYITKENTFYMLSKIDMISFSEIPESEMDFVKEIAAVTSVNYNHLIPANVTSLTIDRYVDKVARIAEVVNHIYLVIFKRPVGSPSNEIVKIGDKSRMASDIRVINTLMERLPESARRKIAIDGCLQDVGKYARTGFGCSSNVSRVQVWPDGSVTGCAYAFGGDKPPAFTAKAIMENIKRCRKEYDFKSSCHLPEVYDSIHQ